MKFPKKNYKRPNIHLTALIDIVFLLLIFFLLSSNFVTQQGIQIIVPKMASESKDLVPEITVRIDQEGNFYYAGFQIRDETLRVLLTEDLKPLKKRKIAVYADRRVEYNRVVELIDIAKGAGAEDFLLISDQVTK